MKTTATNRSFGFAAIAFLAAMTCHSAQAAWPEDRPIEVVVGFAPGGGTDLMARKVTLFMQKHLGGKAQFVVVNKPGAGSEISNAYVARSKPDGYTIAVINTPNYLYVPMTKKAQYSTNDFKLVARVVDDPTVLVVRSDSRFKDLRSVIGELRSKPQSISFGHNGTGTNGDIATQLIALRSKVDLNEIPFKGSASQRTDLLGGHLDVALISAGEVPELHGGKTSDLRVLSQLTSTRSQALPQAPTAQEAGVSVTMSSERGFAAPRGTPDDIVKRLEAAVSAALQDPEFAAAAPADVPVLAFLPGAQWEASLEKNRQTLQEVISRSLTK